MLIIQAGYLITNCYILCIPISTSSCISLYKFLGTPLKSVVSFNIINKVCQKCIILGCDDMSNTKKTYRGNKFLKGAIYMTTRTIILSDQIIANKQVRMLLLALICKHVLGSLQDNILILPRLYQPVDTILIYQALKLL